MPDPKIWADPLAIEMIAAWVNATPETMPPEMRAHTCADTAEAWGRVATAAKKFLLAEIQERAEQGAFGPDHIICHTCHDIYFMVEELLEENSDA